MVNRAEELITQLEAEIVKRDARVADLEAQLEDTEERRENAVRNSPAFEDRMGALQVENGKLQARIAELEAQVSGIRLDVITQIDAHAVTREELAALKAQQPSGVVLPEFIDHVKHARKELCRLEQSPLHLRQRLAQKLTDGITSLNPCRAQSVPDGWVRVPAQMTDAMRDAGNVYTLNRSTLACIWRDMLAAAPSAKKERGDE